MHTRQERKTKASTYVTALLHTQVEAQMEKADADFDPSKADPPAADDEDIPVEAQPDEKEGVVQV